MLTMTRAPGVPGEPPRVAFAIGRPIGNAVARNRLRRRLRALCREEATAFAPGHMYLIGAAPGAADAPFAELGSTLRELLARTASTS
jgi:ribonuclease P protein component